MSWQGLYIAFQSDEQCNVNGLQEKTYLFRQIAERRESVEKHVPMRKTDKLDSHLIEMPSIYNSQYHRFLTFELRPMQIVQLNTYDISY